MEEPGLLSGVGLDLQGCVVVPGDMAAFGRDTQDRAARRIHHRDEAVLFGLIIGKYGLRKGAEEPRLQDRC